MIIGQIDGRDATPKDFRELFSSNSWGAASMDYSRSMREKSYYDSDFEDIDGDTPRDENGYYSLGRLSIEELSQAVPKEGTPVRGYRVFTYLEGKENKLGSPVAGYMTSMETMFGNPQRKDDVNNDPLGRGYYYFIDKGAALAFAQYMTQLSQGDPEYFTGDPLHIVVGEVEGTYINKYARDNDYGQYGELMNDMKVVGNFLIDINMTKTLEAREVLGEYSAYDCCNPAVQRFEMMSSPYRLLFYEQYPEALVHDIYGEHDLGGLSFGHFDISPYKGLSKERDSKEYKQAYERLAEDYNSLVDMFPDRGFRKMLTWKEMQKPQKLQKRKPSSRSYSDYYYDM